MIDGRLPDAWPEAVIESVRRWREGDIVEAPPFFYQRSEANPVWRMEFESDGESRQDELVELDPSERPPYGLITTQTCDLFEEGRPRQPWFAVAPVYDFADRIQAGQLSQLQRGTVGHMVLLSAAWLPPGHWVADLRIEMPVEKGWLVGREPRPGFAELGEARRLAARLGSRRSRPALSTQLTTSLIRPLRDWLNRGGRTSRDNIESLRIRVVGDSATSVQAELLVIVADEGLSQDSATAWRDWERARIDAAHADGVLLFAFRYGTLDAFTARDVESSLLLDYDHLSPD